MKPRYLSTALLVWVVSLAGCASRGPVWGQNSQLRTQPDTGKPVDYLHFAGLSYGDTFDDVVALFGEPTSVHPEYEQDTSPSVSYEINGKDCLQIIYDKPTRRVEFVRAGCGQIRDLLLSKQVDDAKLALLDQHKDSILKKYGSPDETQSNFSYAYDFEAEGGSEGQVDFICEDSSGDLCDQIWVQWFYPMSEGEMTQLLESVQKIVGRVSKQKQEKIRHFMELTKVADQGKEIFDALLSSMKRPLGMSDDAWAEVVKEFNFQELIELMVPVYAKHLTEEEIDDLIAFYSTSTGRSFVDKQPDIFKETLAVSQEWGKKVAQRMQQKLEARKKKTIGP
jgi:uncharacterized protein